MLQEINMKDIKLNPMNDFGKDWMALTAGNEADGYNAMTIAWGHFGSIWERGKHTNCLPTAICYVRPQRYTKTLMDKEVYFTLSHFGQEHKKALAYLGTHSGHDGDKMKDSGFTPVFSDGVTYFAEAKTVYICRKLYQAPLLPEGFIDQDLVEFNYPKCDFHEMYIGEIVKVLTQV